MKINQENDKLRKLLEFGIINIDKPTGPTSFDISDFVRKALGVRKTSHFGTLDPQVTGVLPVALNRACKLTGFFLGHDKEYVGIMRFHEDISLEKIEKAIKEKFTGVIKQIPPVKSRVARRERQREIKSFEILEQDGKDFVFRTVVQGGTYIRKLIDDLGKALGIGAHMLELRRTRAGIFEENKSVTLYELEEAIKKNGLEKLITPAQEAIKKVFPIIEIKEESVDRILHGQPIYYKNLIKITKLDKDALICVFVKNQFVGIFRVLNEKDFFARSEFTMQEIK
jgi:H/ACA ribonucleoprotein complex subunit 4